MESSGGRWQLSWKKILLVLLVLGAVLYILDGALTDCKPGKKEIALEKQLWQLTADIPADSAAFFQAAFKLHAKARGEKSADSGDDGDGEGGDDEGGDEGTNSYGPEDEIDAAADASADKKPVVYDLAAFRKIAAKFDRQMISYRVELEKLAAESAAGYEDDVLLLHAFYLHNFNRFLAIHETRIYRASKENAVPGINWQHANLESLLRSDNKDKTFFYPEQKDVLLDADQSQDLLKVRCCQGHGGYSLWRGCPADAVEMELSDYKSQVYSDSFLLRASKARCAELRRQHGSVLAPLKIVTVNFLDWLWILKSMTILKINMSMQPDYFTDLMELPVYDKCRGADDKVWNTAHYLALTSGNFLWIAKYRDMNNKDSAFLEKCRIRELYDKNGTQMRHYRDYLALDLQRARKQLETAEYKKAPAMRQAALRLCGSAEEILKTWDRYREGRIDYKSFAAALKRDEANYLKAFKEAAGVRWDHLSSRYRGAQWYVGGVLISDGVPENMANELYAEK